jgi:rubredoxin
MKKLLFNYVKNFINNLNYTLISETYENVANNLTIKCNKNHIFKASFNKLQQGRRCPVCSGKQKHTFEYVKNFIEKCGYKLLSTEYTGNHDKLKVQCPEKHIYTPSLHDFKLGYRCPVCSRKQKHSFKQVKEYIEKYEYKLLSTEYVNANKKLKLLCPNNHIYNVSFSSFKNGLYRCPKCNGRGSSNPEKEVITYIKSIYNGIVNENVWFLVKNPITGKKLEIDIFLPEINKAIEIGAFYYHHTDNDLYKEKQKIIQCKEKNIELLSCVYKGGWEKEKLNVLNTIKLFIEGNT